MNIATEAQRRIKGEHRSIVRNEGILEDVRIWEKSK
jgi:hypothetical protein